MKKKKFPFGRNLSTFPPSPLPNKNRSNWRWKENRDYDSSGSILHFSTRRSSRFDRGDYRGLIRAWISPTHLPYRSSWLPKKRLDYRKRSIPLDRFNPKSGIDFYDPRSRGLSSRCKVKCVRTCGRTTLRRRRERRRHRNIILEREPRGQRERERYRFNRYTRLSLYDTSALKGWCISACRCSK